MGAANVAAGLFQGFAVSTSGSRTAVAEQSGAKSQLTGVVGAGLVVVLLLFLNSLLADLPADRARRRRHRRRALADGPRRRSAATGGSGKSALVLSLVATAGVVFFGVLAGIVVAIVLSILMFFRRSWWPHGAVLGQVDGMDGWHDVAGQPGARQLPGIVVYRWEAPLFFANAAAFRRQIRQLARDRQPSWIVLQCEAITDIDVTAADMLEQLDRELNDRGRPPGLRRDARPAAGPHPALRALRHPRPRPLLPHPRRGPRRHRGHEPQRLPRRAAMSQRRDDRDAWWG